MYKIMFVLIYSMNKVRVVNFEDLNFCGLKSLDYFVGLYFHVMIITWTKI